MTAFKIRELRCTDTRALLAFEIHNREWFESHIEARDPAFYSLEGVAEHIADYLADFAEGSWHPFVIESANGEIVGRANLKSIHSPESSAEVGYRVGQRACGQGLATLALQHLVQQAQTRWGLTQLAAYVYDDNIGSQKVLQRCGFLPAPLSPGDKATKERRYELSL